MNTGFKKQEGYGVIEILAIMIMMPLIKCAVKPLASAMGSVNWNDKINISKVKWKEIPLNQELMKSFNMELIIKIYNTPNHKATATELAQDGGKTPKLYNAAVGQLGKRIAARGVWTIRSSGKPYHVICLFYKL